MAPGTRNASKLVPADPHKPTVLVTTSGKCLVPQEGAPRLGGRIASPQLVTGHCGLRDIESMFQQFAMKPWCAP
jgi:hypothetical protein